VKPTVILKTFNFCAVHRLRPQDIDVIGALGDSITVFAEILTI